MIWVSIVPHIPKSSRYTLGTRIEHKFLDLLELTYITYFSEKGVKQEKIAECILLLDTLKFFISIIWEAKLISHKQCEDIVLKIDEVGKMFGGWRKNLENSNKKNPRFNQGES